MQKIASFITKYLSPFAEVLSKIGSWFLVVIMLITVADVIGRKFFNMPVKGTLELISMCLIIFVFFNLPQNEMRGGNVTIDTIYVNFGKKFKKFIDSIMYVPFFAVSVLFTWQLFVLAKDEAESGTTTVILNIPTSPFIYLAAIGFVIMSVTVLARLILIITNNGGRNEW